jgi:cytochrome P450
MSDQVTSSPGLDGIRKSGERSRSGIIADERTGVYRVHGWAEARAALTDSHLDVVREPTKLPEPDDAKVPTAAEFLALWFSRAPRERHRAAKHHLYGPYAEQSIPALEPILRAIAAKHASELKGDCDLIDDFLMPFWQDTTAQMFAVPDREMPRLSKVVTALSTILRRSRLDPGTEHAVECCIRYLRAIVDHLVRLQDQRPAVQALRELRQDTYAGGVWPTVSALAQLLTAGLHPTVTGAALLWRALQTQPALSDAVVSGAFHMSDLVNEILRLDPPFPLLHRWVRDRCECMGAVLKPEAHVIIDLRVANRDRKIFDRPDEFVAGRDGSRSLSFGYGPHRCLGLALARLQIEVVVDTLVSMRPRLRPADAHGESGIDRSGHLTLIKSLPCREAAVYERESSCHRISDRND